MSSISEALALLRLKFARPIYPRAPGCPDLERCYELLKLTSRSFSAVIEQLHPELRNAMMIFYIVLRGLDTLEDDTGLDNQIKIPLLRKFREVLKKPDWTFNESSPTERDRIVLQEFDIVLREYHKLRPEYQDIIADITFKMGNGMADYIERKESKNFDGLRTLEDYDLYCHYVAGIVGEGITRMATFSGFGHSSLHQRPELYESMGLFLQKTNIIRDYREDLDEGRVFWPYDVWSKYADELKDFVQPENRQSGLNCISEMVLHSLKHVPRCLEYLSKISEETLFRFCAIPQVMSIATLELVFNNEAVFDKNVKISKGKAAQLIIGAHEMDSIFELFKHYIQRIHTRNRLDDPNYFAIELMCSNIEVYINKYNHNADKNVAWQQQLTMSEGPRSQASDRERWLLIISVFGASIGTAALMMLITSFFGARYHNPFKLIQQVFK